MTTYLTKSEHAQAKRRLTMAKRKGPQAVRDEVKRTLDDWLNRGLAYPDDWHRWLRADEDAALELRYQR